MEGRAVRVPTAGARPRELEVLLRAFRVAVGHSGGDGQASADTAAQIKFVHMRRYKVMQAESVSTWVYEQSSFGSERCSIG